MERKLYGHDIAAVPALVRPLIGRTLPDAVVQPETEEELVELVRWTAKLGIPLTPRGKATSGYGGAIPVKRGIVVDFYRMKEVLEVDPEALTVTVQGGDRDGRPGAGEARSHAALVSDQLPFLHGSRLAGAGRCRDRFLRSGVVSGLRHAGEGRPPYG